MGGIINALLELGEGNNLQWGFLTVGKIDRIKGAD